MFVFLVGLVLHVLAATTAVILTGKRPDYRPVAIFLAVTALADVALFGFILAGAPTSVPSAPLTGAARVAGHVREALYLVWPFGLVALFVQVFARWRPWPVGLAYAVFLAVLVFGYPTIRGDVLRQAYLAAEVGAFLVSVGLMIMWGWRREWSGLSPAVVIPLLFAEGGVIYGAWRGDIFEGWNTGRLMYATVYAVLCLVQGGALWRLGDRSS
jgi:hypothetical protein